MMDEPTGNLDSRRGAHILELLVETHRRYGTALVMVPHSPVAAAYAERAAFPKDGTIAASLEQSAPGRYDAEVINTPYYSHRESR